MSENIYIYMLHSPVYKKSSKKSNHKVCNNIYIYLYIYSGLVKGSWKLNFH